MLNTSVINGPLPTIFFTTVLEIALLKTRISYYDFKVGPNIEILDRVPGSE